ncbi:NAD(P)-dependent oxidoreductase [Streptomyces sp. HNM0574]|uniref:NAD(P)-dependent oxidoreductase n=1 Tax=Streptomyces sp. HNM0574 TaxID=2714954 RepID=UPI001469DA75|nr:NAD(P)-dependent oxidoreductase [Streptomyces sp. HNM0574]NLU69251.1 NAD(P)-dependent oxidoreductase [Streptomyces sp. HNM0574]
MTDRISVAVLGTGIMGAAMARNLCRAGLDVTVWNRSRAKSAPLADEGARVADRPDEAVENADIVLTMLYDAPTTAEIIRAAAPGLRAGTLWMQSTSAGTEGLRDLDGLAHDYGLVLVDAPVLGTRGPAESGDLVVLASGPHTARHRLAPVLGAVGSRTVWVSERPGDASSLKLVCNTWVLTVNHGVAEALALAEGLGVDPRSFLDAVGGGPLDMGYLRAKAAVIGSGDFSPSFAVTTAEKDSRLIVSAGEAAGVRLDVTAAGAERFRRAAEQGHGQEDMAASYYASFDDGRSQG